MQADPIKPSLKLPGTKRLKLKCDAPLSKFAFNFNLRHYNKEYNKENMPEAMVKTFADVKAGLFYHSA